MTYNFQLSENNSMLKTIKRCHWYIPFRKFFEPQFQSIAASKVYSSVGRWKLEPHQNRRRYISSNGMPNTWRSPMHLLICIFLIQASVFFFFLVIYSSQCCWWNRSYIQKSNSTQWSFKPDILASCFSWTH